jgi:hypothetical protein
MTELCDSELKPRNRSPTDDARCRMMIAGALQTIRHRYRSSFRDFPRATPVLFLFSSFSGSRPTDRKVPVINLAKGMWPTFLAFEIRDVQSRVRARRQPRYPVYPGAENRRHCEEGRRKREREREGTKNGR